MTKTPDIYFFFKSMVEATISSEISHILRDVLKYHNRSKAFCTTHKAQIILTLLSPRIGTGHVGRAKCEISQIIRTRFRGYNILTRYWDQPVTSFIFRFALFNGRCIEVARSIVYYDLLELVVTIKKKMSYIKAIKSRL